jgi:hypothetical protein
MEMTTVKGAGCLFIQGDYVLTGYNPKFNIWSGIGGKVEPGESPRITAYRETIEELFGFNPSQKILDDCEAAFGMLPLNIRDNYGVIKISFDLYVHLSYILRANNCISPFYNKIPISFEDVLTERKKIENAEITELKVINFKGSNPDISTDLLLDCMAPLIK